MLNSFLLDTQLFGHGTINQNSSFNADAISRAAAGSVTPSTAARSPGSWLPPSKAVSVSTKSSIPRSNGPPAVQRSGPTWKRSGRSATEELDGTPTRCFYSLHEAFHDQPSLRCKSSPLATALAPARSPLPSASDLIVSLIGSRASRRDCPCLHAVLAFGSVAAPIGGNPWTTRTIPSHRPCSAVP